MLEPLGRQARTTFFTVLALVSFAANSWLCRGALRGGAIDPASFSAIRLLTCAGMLALVVRSTSWRQVAGAAAVGGSPGATGSWRSAIALLAYALAFSFAYVRLDTGVGALAGAQFVVAINPGSSLAVRDGLGVARYDKIRDFLGGWVGNLPPGNSDDLSLVSNLGTLAAHTAPVAWLQTLDSFNPDLRGAEPSLLALSTAVDVAAEATPRPGMGRAVLFITPHMDLGTLKGLESLGQRAAQEGVRIFVFSFHSPSVMPGGTPYVRSEQDLRDFLDKCRRYFEFFFGTVHGSTMTPLEIRGVLLDQAPPGTSAHRMPL